VQSKPKYEGSGQTNKPNLPQSSNQPIIFINLHIHWLSTAFVSYQPYTYIVGQDSSVGTATRYWLDGPVIESRWGARFSESIQTGPGAHPASFTMGTAPFPGINRPGSGSNHPPHLTTKLKIE